MKRSDIVSTINNLKGEEGHKKILDVYNSQCPVPRGYKVKTTDAWCAATVSAVFVMNGYDGFSECSCYYMVEKAKKLGIWVENDSYVPSPGDVVLYDWQDSGKGDNTGVPDHVGIVISVSKNKIVVREGNKNKSIGNRDVLVNGIFIRGYITPPYDSEAASKPKKEKKTSTKPKTSEKSKEKAPEKPQNSSTYVVGKVYTISVNTSLNVRKGPGKNNGLVGFRNLTPDGKKHATPNGALKNGTRVSCLEIKVITDKNIWIRIPSGWICAVDGSKKFVI